MSSTGSAAGKVALPLVAVATTHAGPLGVSLLTASAWLPWLAIGLPAGAWVDRLARRPLMIVADVVSAVAFVTVVVAAWLHGLTTPQLVAAALVGGCAQVFFATAYRAYLPALVGPDELTRANAALYGTEQAANVTGPGVAGLLAQAVGAVGGVLLDALSFLVSAACLHRVRTHERPSVDRPHRHLRAEIREGMTIMWGDRLLRWNTLYGAASNLALTGYQSLLVVFLVRDLGIPAGTTGLLLALSGVGGLLGAAAAPRLTRRWGEPRAVVISRCVCAPFALLIALTAPGAGLAWFLAGSAVLVAGITLGNVVMSAFVQGYVPRAVYGRVSASSQVINFGAIPLGALTAGLLASATDVRTAVTAMLALVVASVGLTFAGPLRSLRRFPAGPPAGVCGATPDELSLASAA